MVVLGVRLCDGDAAELQRLRLGLADSLELPALTPDVIIALLNDST